MGVVLAGASNPEDTPEEEEVRADTLERPQSGCNCDERTCTYVKVQDGQWWLRTEYLIRLPLRGTTVPGSSKSQLVTQVDRTVARPRW